MPELFTLQGRRPVRTRYTEHWHHWFDAADRTVACTRSGSIIISTQFTGRNFAPAGAHPLLFETLVARQDFSDFCWRWYSTWWAAEEGHEELVRAVKATRYADSIAHVRQLMSIDYAQPQLEATA